MHIEDFSNLAFNFFASMSISNSFALGGGEVTLLALNGGGVSLLALAGGEELAKWSGGNGGYG